MQLRLPWDAPPRRAAREPRTLEAGGRRFPVELVRHRRARRYVLRLTPDGAVRVTVPRGASIAGALRFAATEQAWIVREWTRLSVRLTWPAGTLVWWRGARIALHPADGHVPLAETAVPLGRAATPHDLRPLVQAHLAAIARTELPVRCVVLGQPHGLRPVRISVRDQRSRWGACSARGDDHAQLAPRADAARSGRLRHAARARPPAASEPRPSLLAGRRRDLSRVARRGALAADPRA